MILFSYLEFIGEEWLFAENKEVFVFILEWRLQTWEEGVDENRWNVWYLEDYLLLSCRKTLYIGENIKYLAKL